MNERTVNYEGRDYPVREVCVGGDIGNVLVSVMSLNDALVDVNGCPVSDEAERVDDEIFFYVGDSEIVLSDEEIAKIVLQNI